MAKNLVNCVAEIFRWLKGELAEGRVRNYFIPGNNMLSDVKPVSVVSSRLDETVNQLEDIIHNTFQVR